MEPQHHVFTPGPPLAAYVDHFWLAQDYPSPTIEKLLPDGGLEIILNLGEPQFLYDLHDPRRYRTFRHSWVSGQRSEAILIGASGLGNLIGVRFRLFGAYSFLHLPLHEITDRVNDAEAILGPEVHRLSERIAAAPSPIAKFRLLEKYLLGRLQGRVRQEKLMAFAVETVSEASGDAVQRVMEQSGYSGKQLRRMFLNMVGLTPKALFRVCRLQRVLKRIEESAAPNWPLLAQECGFFDQAHFIKDFKAFTALTPTEYLSQRGPFLNYLPLSEDAGRASR